jgi:hypothetical protein
MRALSDLSQDARDELQALFYFGRNKTPINQSLKSIKRMEGGIGQINYLYAKLLHGEEWFRKSVLTLDLLKE